MKPAKVIENYSNKGNGIKPKMTYFTLGTGSSRNEIGSPITTISDFFDCLMLLLWENIDSHVILFSFNGFFLRWKVILNSRFEWKIKVLFKQRSLFSSFFFHQINTCTVECPNVCFMFWCVEFAEYTMR